MTYSTFILKEKKVDNKRVPFYKHWVDLFGKYEDISIGDKRDNFLIDLEHTHEPWQVYQARKSLVFYKEYINKFGIVDNSINPCVDESWRVIEKKVIKELRFQQKSHNTEKPESV